MPDNRAVSLPEIDNRLREIREQLDDNRRILELLSSAGALSRSKEGRWLRDTLSRRANALRHIVDTMHLVREKVERGDALGAVGEQRKLYGMLLTDSLR